MADYTKVKHLTNKVEADMLVERLHNMGVEAFVQEASASEKKLYSGGLVASNGVDVYVAASNKDKVAELLHQWETEVPEEAMLEEEAVKSSKIPADIQEYLSEMEKDHQASVAKRILWSKRSKWIVRIVAACILIFFVALLVMILVK